jgi:hypothetical protein
VGGFLSKKEYQYSKFYPSIIIVFLVVTPAVIFSYISKIGFGNDNFENAMIFILCLPILIMLMAPLVWLSNIYATTISINDNGLEVRNLLGKKVVNWSEISTLNKKAYFSGNFPSYGPPEDLDIVTANKKKIKIYWFIKSGFRDDDGIKEIENEIRKNLRSAPQMSAPDTGQM